MAPVLNDGVNSTGKVERRRLDSEVDDWDLFLDFKCNPNGNNKRELGHRLIQFISMFIFSLSVKSFFFTVFFIQSKYRSIVLGNSPHGCIFLIFLNVFLRSK